MKEQDIIRYLDYLGVQEQQPQNQRRASSVSRKNFVRAIVVLMGVLVLLGVSAIGYHAATVFGEGHAVFMSNVSYTQGAPAGDQPPGLWDGYSDHVAHCYKCQCVILFSRLVSCLASGLLAVSTDGS